MRGHISRSSKGETKHLKSKISLVLAACLAGLALLGIIRAATAETILGITAFANNINSFGHIDLPNVHLNPLRQDIGGPLVGFLPGATTVDAVGRRFFVMRLINNSPSLLVLDTQTGQDAQAPLSLNQTFISLGFDPIAGVLFGITTLTTNPAGQMTNQFAHIDLVTGHSIFRRDIGDKNTGFPAGSTAVDQEGQRFFIIRLIGVGRRQSLLTLNTQTGDVVGDVFLQTDRIFINLGFDRSTGALFGVTSAERNMAGQIVDFNRFAQIDPATGGVTFMTVVGGQNIGFVAGAHAVDHVLGYFLVERSINGKPSLLVLDTQTGQDAQAPLALEQTFISLGFDPTCANPDACIQTGGFCTNPRNGALSRYRSDALKVT